MQLNRNQAIALGAVAVAILGGWLVAPIVTGTKVRRLDRLSTPPAKRSAKLQRFFDDWERDGPFRIVVIAGARTRAQILELYAQGRTKPGAIVTNVKDTATAPHAMRGGKLFAADVAPDNATATGPVWNDEAKFRVIGERARAAGLTWGGDFKSLKDMPHIEDPEWRLHPPDEREAVA